MEGHVAAATDYKDIVLFLVTAGVVVPLFRRAKISPVLGFLLAGVVLGPFGLGALSDRAAWLSTFTINDPDQVAQLAELGVVFLLFMIGLELSGERLRLMRRLVFGLGGLQVAVCLTVVAAAAHALGQPWPAALVIGAALALSSTAIVMPLLAEHKRQHSQAGRAIFAVLLFQDLAVAPILITLSIAGSQAGEVLSPQLLLAFGPAALGLLALVVAGRLLLRPMMKSVARAKSDELFMAACLLVVIGAGLVSALAGLSMALGAFIAGLLLAETEFRHQIEVTIEPFKGLLLGLFFVSVGITLDLSILVSQFAVVAGIAAGLFAVTGAVVLVLAKAFGLAWRKAAEAALLLAAGGEFAFVIIDNAIAGGLVERSAGQTVLVAATLSMFTIPALSGLAMRIGGKTGGSTPVEAPPTGSEGPKVLVVGYGRVGRLVGEMLDAHEIPWAGADRDTKSTSAARREGKAIFFGDASKPEFLLRCGLDTAPALVVTMDSPEGVEAVVAAARGLKPDLTIVARARDARHAHRLYDLGATDAVPETIEASLQLSEAVLVDIGIPMGLVIASIHERRDVFRKMLNRPDALGGRVRRARDAMKRG